MQLAAIVIYLDVLDEGVKEPWVGCYLMETLTALQGTEWNNGEWALDLQSNYHIKWTTSHPETAFGWSEPRKPGVPVKICGYYLHLTVYRTRFFGHKVVVTRPPDPARPCVPAWG